MAKVTISIQLNDAEIKALSAMQISENESLNQTATRLLKGILGQSKAGLTLSGGDEIQEIVRQQVIALTSSTPAGDEDIKQILRQELTDAIAQIKGLIDERLGGVALPTQEAVSVEQQVIPDYEAIRSSILSKFKVGKQSAAKAIDAFIEELDAVAAKQQLETEESDVAS
ncbi:MAG: hypothetical protein KME32_30695 [Mojavia pulchra JT2-VF2]|jgi:hypothetical protein|uniref:Uncharacterized protein n=1 Tax=Mojavia pulchra JT2-VF2 TaxID=287848 RepID=A0A951Q4V6_9NOST|nr:hypothetical protein [Mojavia pulchra JT2-VF2]